MFSVLLTMNLTIGAVKAPQALYLTYIFVALSENAKEIMLAWVNFVILHQ